MRNAWMLIFFLLWVSFAHSTNHEGQDLLTPESWQKLGIEEAQKIPPEIFGKYTQEQITAIPSDIFEKLTSEQIGSMPSEFVDELTDEQVEAFVTGRDFKGTTDNELSLIERFLKSKGDKKALRTFEDRVKHERDSTIRVSPGGEVEIFPNGFWIPPRRNKDGESPRQGEGFLERWKLNIERPCIEFKNCQDVRLQSTPPSYHYASASGTYDVIGRPSGGASITFDGAFVGVIHTT